MFLVVSVIVRAVAVVITLLVRLRYSKFPTLMHVDFEDNEGGNLPLFVKLTQEDVELKRCPPTNKTKSATGIKAIQLRASPSV